MGKRRERSAFATKREIHGAEVRDDGNSRGSGDYGGLAELHRRGDLSASGAARRQMKKSVAMRSDEGDVGHCDARASRDLDCGAAKFATEREVERGDRRRADFLVGGSCEQFLPKAPSVRERSKCHQTRGRTRTLVEFGDGGAHAVVRCPRHQADGENLTAIESNRDCAHFLSASGSSSSSDSCESSGRLNRSISIPASNRRKPEGTPSEPESSCDSGTIITFLPRCHWMSSIWWPSWRPVTRSIEKPPNIVLVRKSANAARSIASSQLPALARAAAVSRPAA